MKKLLAICLFLFVCSINQASACTDFMINTKDFHIVARTMDFPKNVGNSIDAFFIGQENITSIIVNQENIPELQWLSWKNKYGFIARTVFDTPMIVDGLNSEGLSVAYLYLDEAKEPQYNPQDTRPVIGYYDVGNYLLGNAATVKEALDLIATVQIVQSAVELKDGLYIKSVPLHMVIRDKTGKSAVIEVVDEKVNIYPDAGDVFANSPTYDKQLEHNKLFDFINTHNPDLEAARKMTADFDNLYKVKDSTVSETLGLIGLPGDYSSMSRFVRVSQLLKNIMKPESTQQALLFAELVLNTVIQLPLGEDYTNWTVIKDLDNKVFYTKTLGFIQQGMKYFPMGITNDYVMYDLKAINFKEIPEEYVNFTIKPVESSKIKQIIDGKTLGF